MKRLLSLCIAFFCSFWVIAQDQVSWSAPLNDLIYNIRDIFFFKDHGYLLRVNDSGFGGKKNKSLIQQLDNGLNYKKEVEIKLIYEGNKAEPRQLITLNDKLFLVYIGYTEQEKRLLLSEIDTDNLNFIGDPVILGTVSSSSGEILMERSKNGRFFAVLAYQKNEENTKVSIICYEDNLQRIYEDEKNLNLKYSSDAFSQLVVDDEGNTFILMQEHLYLAPPSPPIFWQRFRSGENIVRGCFYFTGGLFPVGSAVDYSGL